MKLVSAFQERLEAQDMESFLFDKTKLCVRLLAGALEPMPFRVVIRKELKMEVHRKIRADLHMFIDWVIPRMEAFMMFESSLPKDMSEKKLRMSDQSNDNEKRPWIRKKKAPKAIGAVGEVEEVSVAGVIGTEAKKGPGKKQKKNCCSKCGSEEHGVFHCPRCNEEEARALWSQNRGAREGKADGHVSCASANRGKALPASVEGHPVRITLDTGADQSIVSQEAVTRLESVGIELERRRMKIPLGLRSF